MWGRKTPQDTRGQGGSRASPTPLMSVLLRSEGSYSGGPTTSTGGILNDVTTIGLPFPKHPSSSHHRAGHWRCQQMNFQGTSHTQPLARGDVVKKAGKVNSHLHLRPEDGN